MAEFDVEILLSALQRAERLILALEAELARRPIHPEPAVDVEEAD